MKVKELLEMLQAVDPEMEVLFRNSSDEEEIIFVDSAKTEWVVFTDGDGFTGDAEEELVFLIEGI